jgi:hypothetical protein
VDQHIVSSWLMDWLIDWLNNSTHIHSLKCSWRWPMFWSVLRIDWLTDRLIEQQRSYTFSRMLTALNPCSGLFPNVSHPEMRLHLLSRLKGSCMLQPFYLTTFVWRSLYRNIVQLLP